MTYTAAMAGLKFRILLDSQNAEEVFYDIVIAEDESFETFYQSIITAFCFRGDQMASFYVSNDEWDKGEEISLLDLSEGDGQSTLKNMKSAILKECITVKDQKFILVYDFFKMWIFLIELVGVEETAPKTPKVVLSVGENPNEDQREISEEFQMPMDDLDENGTEDFGFDDFEDGFSDEDLNSI